MTEKKKREKVVAEITLTHLTEFAEGLGLRMSHEEAIAFLNQNGRAYDMWKHMMHAGEEYIKSALAKRERGHVVPMPRSAAQRGHMAV
jgi:hypothetical protein